MDQSFLQRTAIQSDIPGHNEVMLTAFGTDISSRSPVARSSKILTEAARSPWGIIGDGSVGDGSMM